VTNFNTTFAPTKNIYTPM